MGEQTFKKMPFPGEYHTEISELILTSNPSAPYEQTVSNVAVGISHTVSSGTMCELALLVRREKELMDRMELNQFALGIASSKAESAKIMTDFVQENRRKIEEILEFTLNFDDRIDWNKLLIADRRFAFTYEKQPEKPEMPEKSGAQKIFAMAYEKECREIEEKYKSDCNKYSVAKNKALLEYVDSYKKFQKARRENNNEIRSLKCMFELSEKSAVEHYCSMVLTNSQYPQAMRLEKSLHFRPSESTLYVNFFFERMEKFPLVSEYVLDECGEIAAVKMPAEQARDFYEKTLLTVCVRTFHEIYEADYTESVKNIVFRGRIIDKKNNSVYQSRCVFIAQCTREDFLEIPLETATLDEILHTVSLKRVDDFSDRLQLMPV